MKLEGHFDSLLEDTVNLTRGRLELLEKRAATIYQVMQDDPVVGPMVLGMQRQGSWAQATIINPPTGREFDADFTLQMEDDSDWTPREYLRAVRRAVKNSPNHNEMTLQRKNRCVRVVYVNQFHVDVVPSVTRDGVEYIANYDTDQWERTNPDGFTSWMQQQDQACHGNLRRVIRLMKFVRNRKGFTGVRSIILTTLFGDQVDPIRELGDGNYYGDLPTAFLHLVTDLDAYTWAREAKPTVWDPSGTGLTFDHRWEQPTYDYFRTQLHAVAEAADAAYHCDDPDESEQLWQNIFGPDFKDSSGETDTPRFGAPASTTGYIAGRAG